MANSLEKIFTKCIKLYNKTIETLGCLLVIGILILFIYLLNLLINYIFGVNDMSLVEKKIFALYIGLVVIIIYIHGIWVKTYENGESANRYQEILYERINKLESNIEKHLDKLNNK